MAGACYIRYAEDAKDAAGFSILGGGWFGQGRFWR